MRISWRLEWRPIAGWPWSYCENRVPATGMKEIGELNFPIDLLYAQEHEWVKIMDHTAIIGISDYAQDQLGDIVYVELPARRRTSIAAFISFLDS